MLDKRDTTKSDTANLMAFDHECWLELAGTHGHVGGEFEARFKWGHNMQTDGLVAAAGIKTWLVTPAGEAKELALAAGGPEHYVIRFPTSAEGFYKVVAIFCNQFAQVLAPIGHDLQGVPRKAGVPLEIGAPTWKQWKAGDEINLQLQFNGEPLEEAAVDVVFQGPEGRRNWREMTGANGGIAITARYPGYYLIVARHRVQEKEKGVYDETVFTATFWFIVTK